MDVIDKFPFLHLCHARIEGTVDLNPMLLGKRPNVRLTFEDWERPLRLFVKLLQMIEGCRKRRNENNLDSDPRFFKVRHERVEQTAAVCGQRRTTEIGWRGFIGRDEDSNLLRCLAAPLGWPFNGSVGIKSLTLRFRLHDVPFGASGPLGLIQPVLCDGAHRELKIPG